MDTQTFYSFSIVFLQNHQLARQILPIARKYLSDSSKLTNEWNYKNTYSCDEGLALEKDLEFFKNFILEKSRDYLDSKSIKLKKNKKLWVSMFASEMTKGDQHLPHNHPGALLSGLIYLQVPENAANLEFSSPRCNNIAWSSLLDSESYSYKTEIFEVRPDHTISVTPQEGLFLFWESWALHRVPVNDSFEPRITMVFNVGIDDV